MNTNTSIQARSFSQPVLKKSPLSGLTANTGAGALHATVGAFGAMGLPEDFADLVSDKREVSFDEAHSAYRRDLAGTQTSVVDSQNESLSVKDESGVRNKFEAVIHNQRGPIGAALRTVKQAEKFRDYQVNSKTGTITVTNTDFGSTNIIGNELKSKGSVESYTLDTKNGTVADYSKVAINSDPMHVALHLSGAYDDNGVISADLNYYGHPAER